MKPFTVTLLRHGDTPLSGRLIGQRSDPPPTAAAQVQLAATLAQLMRMGSKVGKLLDFAQKLSLTSSDDSPRKP